jgi:hypothetical protein
MSEVYNNSQRNFSNSVALIFVLASNNLSASAPARYLQLGCSAISTWRTISATTLGDEPLTTLLLDLSIMLFVISMKGDNEEDDDE